VQKKEVKMSYKMGVLILHGIGSQSNDFADAMISEVKKRVDKAGFNSSEISFRPVHWAPVLSERERALWCKLSYSNKLDWRKLRTFIISHFADAIAYNQREPNDIYSRIHKIMHDELVELRKEDFENQDKPLVLMGHSLGGHIMSNYIWDRQHCRDSCIFGDTPLEKMETLTGIITFGCNIPLFTLAYDPIVSIEFPPKKLKENLKKIAQWNNFYDSDDVLGYPLKPLSPSYKKSVHRDIQINVGNIITSWNMFSHMKYWTDNDFTKQVAGFLTSILSQL
jgi:hypothetical protein